MPKAGDIVAPGHSGGPLLCVNSDGIYQHLHLGGIDSSNTSTTPLAGATSLDGGISEASASVAVADSAGFSAGQTIKVGKECIIIGAVDGNTFVECVRGAKNSTVAAHADGDPVYAMYVGAWKNVTVYNGISISLSGTAASVCPGKIQMQFSHDGTTVHRSIDILVPDVATAAPRTIEVITQYFRIIYENANVPQTSFSLQIMLHEQQVSMISRLNQNISDNIDVTNVRSVIVGRQPDGDYVNTPADGSAFMSATVLTDGAAYVSPWADTDGWTVVTLFVASDVVSATNGVEIQYTDDTQIESPIIRATRFFTFTTADVARGFLLLNLSVLLDGFRVIYTNGPTNQGAFFLQTDLRTIANPSTFNLGGALEIADFNAEVALGEIHNYTHVGQLGRNSGIDQGSAPEDIVGTGKRYGGHDATSPEAVHIRSTNKNDKATGTGARIVQIHGLRTPTSEGYEVQDIVMRGKTDVSSAPTTWHRVIRAVVMTAGSNEGNLGTISVTGATTGSVYTTVRSGLNQSSDCVYTVPAKHNLLIRSLRVGITRSQGEPGSAFVTFRVRDAPGGVFRSIRQFDLSHASNVVSADPGIVLGPATDLKFRVESVSDNNTTANAQFEGQLIQLGGTPTA